MDEYLRYKEIMIDNHDINSSLKSYHQELIQKYGKSRADILWDSFITIYTTT